MRILVTGSEGLLGRHVMRALLEMGHEAIGLDRTRPASNEHPFIAVDLTDAAAVEAAMPPCDTVVHLAARPSLDAGGEWIVWTENVLSLTSCLLRAEALGIPRIVFASSQSALGLPTAPSLIPPDYLPVDEDHPCRPADGYSLSKLVGEQFCAMLGRRSGVAIIALRFPVIWDPERHAHFVKRRMDAAEQGPKSLWAYADTRDAARATCLAATRDLSGFTIVNITSASPFATDPTPVLVEKWFPSVASRGPIAADTPLFDNRRAISVLGFRARFRWTPSGIVEMKD